MRFLKVLDAVADTWSRHLFVYPVNGVVPISPDDCFGFWGDYIPTSSYESGVDDADMVIYVGAEEEAEVADGSIETLCDEGKLAFAFTCSVDQFDRPVIGAINFCLSNVFTRQLEEEERKLTFLPQQVGDEGLPTANILDGDNLKADLARVAIHEVAHVLGFSFYLFKYFRDPETGEPLTPRPFVGHYKKLGLASKQYDSDSAQLEWHNIPRSSHASGDASCAKSVRLSKYYWSAPYKSTGSVQLYRLSLGRAALSFRAHGATFLGIHRCCIALDVGPIRRFRVVQSFVRGG
jgi:hypothetical protein